MQGDLKYWLKGAKEEGRSKVDGRLQQNNTRVVWSGIRTITSFKPKNGKATEGSVSSFSFKIGATCRPMPALLPT